MIALACLHAETDWNDVEKSRSLLNRPLFGKIASDEEIQFVAAGGERAVCRSQLAPPIIIGSCVRERRTGVSLNLVEANPDPGRRTPGGQIEDMRTKLRHGQRQYSV